MSETTDDQVPPFSNVERHYCPECAKPIEYGEDTFMQRVYVAPGGAYHRTLWIACDHCGKGWMVRLRFGGVQWEYVTGPRQVSLERARVIMSAHDADRRDQATPLRDFVRRGQDAQAAVDAVLAEADAELAKPPRDGKPPKGWGRRSQ